MLAGTPELQVAARTSSFSFKGKPMEVPEIAAALNVRMVLEGSVRQQGDKVRITAQLIDAQNGFHLWSQTYDRKLEDIFAIQDEIARAIGDELKVKIASPTSPGQDSAGTRNLEAYDLYLRGMALWHTRNEEKLWQAVDLFNQAIAADPKFAQAYGGLGLAYAVIPDYSARISYENAFRLVTDAAGMALGLDPTLPEPYVALSAPASWERRRNTAITLYRRAIAIRPSFATAYQWLGTDTMMAGDPQAGLVALDRASELDPRSLVVANNRAYVLLTLGRVADARATCERVLAFAPDYRGCQIRVAFAELLRGDPEAARPYLHAIARTGDGSALPLVDEVVDALKGRWRSAGGGAAPRGLLRPQQPRSDQRQHLRNGGNACAAGAARGAGARARLPRAKCRRTREYRHAPGMADDAAGAGSDPLHAAIQGAGRAAEHPGSARSDGLRVRSDVERLLDGRNGRFPTFGLLYVSEGTPYGFTSIAMVAFMASRECHWQNSCEAGIAGIPAGRRFTDSGSP